MKQDEQRIGLEVNNKYQLITALNYPLEGMDYIGPMPKAMYWEAIAASKLRIHAHQLGQQLAKQN